MFCPDIATTRVNASPTRHLHNGYAGHPPGPQRCERAPWIAVASSFVAMNHCGALVSAGVLG